MWAEKVLTVEELRQVSEAVHDRLAVAAVVELILTSEVEGQGLILLAAVAAVLEASASKTTSHFEL